MLKKANLLICLCILISSPAFSQELESNEVLEVPSGWWQIPQAPVIFTFGGYVKADIIYDFDAIDSADLMPRNNFRPTQPLNDRKVYASK